MRIAWRTFVVSAVIALEAWLIPAVAAAQPIPPGCDAGVLPHGALSLICVPPAGWNGQLVVFAHGYIAPDQPLGFYDLTLRDGTSIPGIVESAGFAFATTSYRKNGLAIVEGVDDIRELVAAFSARGSVPLRTFVAGASEGGLVATLLAERSPEMFWSALATCGPIGSFLGQLDYIGDFRVLFDYFFPGVIPGSPIDIPASVKDQWSTTYVPRITAALAAHPSEAAQLIRTSHAAIDPADLTTVANTTLDLLWYNVFGTNEAAQELGGNSYGNRLRLYFGSSNDLRLNLRVERFTASPAALRALRSYETSGQLSIPLVTLHTTADDVVPFAHELLYGAKVDLFNRGAFIPIPAPRYGHCNFMTTEVLNAFLLTVTQP
jgi:pimeloyl-ACP methyl ester carboxylesterase